MARIGSLGEFNVEEDDWNIYIERVKLYLKANSIKQDVQVPVFLTVMGSKAYKKLRTLCSPAAPETKSFDELVAVMAEKGGIPKPTKIAARYNFGLRRQQEGESVSAFHLALKEAAADCEFAGELETRLMEQLVAGIANKSTQEELLIKKNLDYKEALQTALSRECALKEAAAFTTHSSNSTPVHKVGFKKQSKPKCKCCGKTNHKFEDCYFKDKECHQCHRTGHIKPMCPTKRQEPRKSYGKKNKSVKTLDMYDSDSDEIPLKALYVPLNRISAPPIVGTVHINELPLKMEIDTGAAVSVIGIEDYKSLKLNESMIKTTDIRLETYTKEAITPLGICKVKVAYRGKTYGPLDLYVIDSTATPLFGRQWLQTIKLDWHSIHKVDEHTVPANVDELKRKYGELFSDTIGRLKGIKAKVEVNENARPVFLRARPVPLSLKELVNQDIERLITNDIISPVKHSDWATPIVPVQKNDGSIRICGDFKVTVNPVLNVDKYPQPRREELFANLAEESRSAKST